MSKVVDTGEMMVWLVCMRSSGARPISGLQKSLLKLPKQNPHEQIPASTSGKAKTTSRFALVST